MKEFGSWLLAALAVFAVLAALQALIDLGRM